MRKFEKGHDGILETLALMEETRMKKYYSQVSEIDRMSRDSAEMVTKLMER